MTKTKSATTSVWTGTTVVHPQRIYLKLRVEQFGKSSSKSFAASGGGGGDDDTDDDDGIDVSLLPHNKIEPAIIAALVRMYGQFGSGILHFDFVHAAAPKPVDGHAVLVTPVEHHQRIWAALTAFSVFNGTHFRFTVTHATPFLFALSWDQDCN